MEESTQIRLFCARDGGRHLPLCWETLGDVTDWLLEEELANVGSVEFPRDFIVQEHRRGNCQAIIYNLQAGEGKAGAIPAERIVELTG